MSDHLASWKGRCQRCDELTIAHTMSKFNTELICMDCKDRDTHDPGVVCVEGYATYYTVKSCQSEGTSGVYTASGQRFDENDMTCAMRDRHWGRELKVTNAENGKTCIVRLNDFGPGKSPASKGVVIDLTPTAWKALGVTEGRGKIRVKVESVNSRAKTEFEAAYSPPDTRKTPAQIDPF